MKIILQRSYKEIHGYALMMTLLTVALGAIILGSALQYSSTGIVQSRRNNDSIRAFLTAEAGLEAAKAQFVSTNGPPSTLDSFAKYYAYDDPTTTTDERNAPNKFNFFSNASTMTSKSISYNGAKITLSSNVNFQGGTYNVTITGKRGHSDNFTTLYAKGDVQLVAVGQYNGVTRTIHETFRLWANASKVFDYAYFINNWGWMWPGLSNPIFIYGDVRSNGDFSYKNNPTVDGYTTAAKANGAAGNIVGTSVADSLSSYYTAKTNRSRPGNPADPGYPSTSVYSPGYDGVAGNGVPGASYIQKTDPLNMPYLGTVDDYVQLATDKASSIKYWDSTLNKYTQLNVQFGATEKTSGVETHGTYAKYYSPQNGKGCALYLSGDTTHPVIINGPFVVNGDAVFKGVFTGQGAVIARRNVYIVGNLTAQTPPTYPSKDSTPYTTYATNAGKDMIGLAARGNIIAGNYMGSPNFAGYAKPPTTKSYLVDPRDADNGYVTSTDSQGSWFNGDYTKQDKNFDGTLGTKSDGKSRKYYESTFSDTTMSSLFVPRANLTQIDAIMYCNHLIGGDIGGVTFNGTVVGRDEAFIYQGTLRFAYDERINSNHGQNVLNIFLPFSLSRPVRLTWREGN